MHDHPDPSRPTLLSVCSGIGGLDLALERVLGAVPVGYVERDAYAQAVLLARMEDEALGCAPVWDDLLTFPGEQFSGLVDILAGGIPCQPHSLAGKQRRGDDERDLIDGFLELAWEVGPRLVFVENVRGFVAGDGLGRLLGGLANLGFDAEWACVRASDVGAPHRRERVFVLAHAHRPDEGRGAHEVGEPKRGTPADGDGRDVAHPLSCAPERRGEPGVVRGEARGDQGEGHQRQRSGAPADAGREGLGDWPPGPQGDWSGVPEWLHPATQPGNGLLDDGPASLVDLAQQYRTDRLRCLGNAVVPQQAEAALRALLRRIR